MKIAFQLIALPVVLVLSNGCVTSPERQVLRSEFESTTPMCESTEECEQMWSAARRWLLSHSGWKLEHITDDFLETYNPTQYSPELAVRVEKIPQSNSRYQIVVTTWCANLLGCVPDKLEAAVDFNRTLNAISGNRARGRAVSPATSPTNRSTAPGVLDELEQRRAIMAMQVTLQREKYYEGPLDGFMNQQLYAAVMKYKNDKLGSKTPTMFDPETLRLFQIR